MRLVPAVRTERRSTCRGSRDAGRHVFWADAEEGLLGHRRARRPWRPRENAARQTCGGGEGGRACHRGVRCSGGDGAQRFARARWTFGSDLVACLRFKRFCSSSGPVTAVGCGLLTAGSLGASCILEARLSSTPHRLRPFSFTLWISFTCPSQPHASHVT